MTLAGYIADRSCPTDPEHGKVWDMAAGGYFCSHAGHNFPVITQSFWTEDQFQEAKSLPTPQPDANGNTKVKKTRRRR